MSSITWSKSASRKISVFADAKARCCLAHVMLDGDIKEEQINVFHLQLH